MAEAFVTLATSDAYCMGCLVVGKCLRKHGTTRKLVVMVSPELSKTACSSLQEVFDEVIMVAVLDSRDRTHLSWLGRPELGVTFTKLRCWTLTQYTKCVFLDADTLVLCNVDELFDREELSAAPDPGWPDCFNSGVFVFTPSLETHSCLLDHANIHGSFDGGDQGLLNSFFSDWAIKDINKHLPFIYNLSATAIYTYLPAFQRFGHQAKIVHFLGATKPWHLPYNPRASNESDFYQNPEQFVNLWWTEYYSQTGMNVQEPQDPQDSVLREHKLQLPVPHPTAAHPQEQALDEEPPSQTFSDLSLIASNSSTNQQQEETPNPEPVSADHTVELKPSDFQELQFGQEQENCESEETENQSPPSAEVQSDTASGGQSEDSSEHRRRWEEGHIDYLGKDAFENIRVKLDQFLQQ